MDPYDFAATMLPQDQRDAITAFWEAFAAGADTLDHAFESRDGDLVSQSVGVMEALKAVSENLMWEFGPSDRGHALCVTAEWRSELRALARLVVRMAPDLPRWVFHDARTSTEPEHFDEGNFTARFRQPLTLTRIEVERGTMGRLNLVGYGTGEEEALADQTYAAATSLLGEEVERDWVGATDGVPQKPGFLSRFSKSDKAGFDAKGFVDAFRAAIAATRADMPEVAYADLSMDERQYLLFRLEPPREDNLRPDLITYSTSHEIFGQAVLSRAPFSSRCHSNFDEWFLLLKVARSDAHPFNDVSERGDIEDMLHKALSEDKLGGYVGGGQGMEAIYMDFAVTDVERAVARIQQAMAEQPFVADATLHFLDAGLEDLVIPVQTATSQVQ